jgi:hypothetical protein
MEEWRPVVGYEDLYEVSNKGRVKSLARVVICGRGTRRIKGRELKRQFIGRYPSVMLYINDIDNRFLVHRLVLEAFVGPCPEGMECRHLNGDPEDNRWPENLVWGTSSENAGDRRRHGTTGRGERNPRAKLTDERIRQVRESLPARGTRSRRGHCPAKNLAKELGVSLSTINQIRYGKTWSHVS